MEDRELAISTRSENVYIYCCLCLGIDEIQRPPFPFPPLPWTWSGPQRCRHCPCVHWRTEHRVVVSHGTSFSWYMWRAWRGQQSRPRRGASTEYLVHISLHERPLKCHVSSCGWMKFDVARWGRLAIRGVGSAPLPLQPLTYTTRMVGERGEGNLESYPFDHPGIVFASGLQTAGCHQPVL